MAKILMLSVRPDEQATIKAWQDRHPGVEVTTAAWELRASTVNQTAGFDGLVIQQRYNIEAEVYPKLKALGFKQISARTAGFDVLDLNLAKQNNLVVGHQRSSLLTTLSRRTRLSSHITLNSKFGTF